VSITFFLPSLLSAFCVPFPVSPPLHFVDLMVSLIFYSLALFLVSLAGSFVSFIPPLVDRFFFSDGLVFAFLCSGDLILSPFYPFPLLCHIFKSLFFLSIESVPLSFFPVLDTSPFPPFLSFLNQKPPLPPFRSVVFAIFSYHILPHPLLTFFLPHQELGFFFFLVGRFFFVGAISVASPPQPFWNLCPPIQRPSRSFLLCRCSGEGATLFFPMLPFFRSLNFLTWRFRRVFLCLLFFSLAFFWVQSPPRFFFFFHFDDGWGFFLCAGRVFHLCLFHVHGLGGPVSFFPL